MSQEKITALKTKAKIDFKHIPMHEVYNRMPKILERAKELKAKKNYNESYVVFTKYINCYDWLKNMKKTDKKYNFAIDYKTIKSEDIETAKKEQRALNKIITDEFKYKETKELTDSVEEMQIDDVSRLLPETPTDEPTSQELENINPKELFSLIKTQGDRTLIIDIRPEHMFAMRHMVAEKYINIPPKLFTDAKIPSTTERLLKGNDKKLFHERDKKYIDTIVIVDEVSSKSSNVETLFDNFKSWDLNVKYGRITALEGGFDSWLHTYPAHAVDNTINVTLRNKDRNAINDMLNNVEYNFDNEIANGLNVDKNQDHEILSFSPLPKIANNFDHLKPNKILPVSKTKLILDQPKSILQGTVKPRIVSSSVLKDEEKIVIEKKPSVDRSSKPSFEINPLIKKLTEYLEFLKKYHQLLERNVDREESLLASVRDFDVLKRDKELQENLAVEQSMNTELEKYREGTKILTAMNLSTIEKKKKVQLELKIGEYTQNIRSCEIKRDKLHKKLLEGIHTEPLKSDGYSGGNPGIKRSHSSPNLAQIKSRQVPQVDRSSKPSTLNQHAENRRLTMSASERKSRMEPVNRTSCHPGITGLKNLGNSCYMNSIIQCLSNTVTLAKYFNENKHSNDLNDRTNKNGMQGQVAEEVAQVIKALWWGHYKSITPRDLKTVIGQYKLQFESHDQQDSHEFLTFLLDWMHNDLKKDSLKKILSLTNAEKEWNKATFNQSSVISQLFFGQLRSTVCCGTCENNSTTYEIFNSLTMSLSQSSKCTLDDCIKRFVSPQSISGWKCPDCKVPRDATKKFDFVKLSPIIVIHLNRFGESDGWLEKKNTVVDFPLTDFNLEPYIARDEVPNNKRRYVYYLYATSNHSGTMEGGHYTAYCKNDAQNKWFKYDDHTVAEVPQSQVKSQTTSAYLLFYSLMLDPHVPIHKLDS